LVKIGKQSLALIGTVIAFLPIVSQESNSELSKNQFF
jgi:hypothetical protein